jgi:transcriptional regulator GlxA family with amidase domain
MRAMKDITLRFYKERLLQVLVHIQQRLDEPLGLEELARLACLSPHHFHHVFTGMLGESLASHIRLRNTRGLQSGFPRMFRRLADAISPSPRRRVPDSCSFRRSF